MYGIPDRTPIFILGMPRSGTSLVEQILSSHPEIHGAGELNDLAQLTQRLCVGKTSQRYPEGVIALDGNDLSNLARQYVVRLRELDGRVTYITDKMPHNFAYLGLIKTILPHAKVIHCVRHPMDTCLSIYKHYFGSSGHRYAYDLTELGQYYRLYEDLMSYWDRLMPGFMYRLEYERLVVDQEAQTRQLLAYCDLPWHADCLRFERAQRHVTTASCYQVRRPMYRDSVGVWEQYGACLDPLHRAIYEE